MANKTQFSASRARSGKNINSYKGYKTNSKTSHLLSDSDDSSLSSIDDAEEDDDSNDDEDDEDDDKDDDGDEDDDDDEDDEDDDDDPSDSSSVSSFSFNLHKKQTSNKPLRGLSKNSRPKAVLPLPKRIDLRKLRSESVESAAESKSSAIVSDDEVSIIDTPVKTSNSWKRRQSLVVDQPDDIDFPRSNLGSDIDDIVLENTFVDDADNELDVNDDNDDDDFEDASLLELLDQDDNSIDELNGFEDRIEEEEEEAIVNEMESKNGALSSPGVMAWDNKSLLNDNYGDEDEDDEDGDNDDEDTYYSDVFFESKDSVPPNGIVLSSQVPGSNLSDDDSYLWSYFFTSSGESGDDIDNGDEKRSVSNNSFYSEFHDEDDISAGESTDEDLSLPPPSHRKVGTRATEVLSSSHLPSRPPVLGTWVMTTERPVGIIDGLTTRTLSPPPLEPTTEVPSYKSHSRKRSRSQNGSFNSDGEELSELALDEFIYTSGLSEDENNDAKSKTDDSLLSSTPVWSSRADVPLSAFRNRGMQASYTQPMHHNHRRHYLSNGRRRTNSKEVLMTPVRLVSNKKLRKRMRYKKKSRDQQTQKDFVNDSYNNDYHNETTDLIDVGALSPLFSGLS